MDKNKIWFVVGSQHLYGQEPLAIVQQHADEIVAFLNQYTDAEIVGKPIVTTASEIEAVMKAANEAEDCIGVMTWMHTFSPSKMWISGIRLLKKPICHFHTQFNDELPYDTIDMDFMNLNQAAHGDREHGFLYAAMRKPRKVIVGYWKHKETIDEINTFISACIGYKTSSHLRICRFGDNMREVAVTEGSKVNAQIKLGWSVEGYGPDNLMAVIEQVTEDEIDALMKEYEQQYEFVTEDIAAIREQAKYEIGIERFLKDGGFHGFTTTFENLGALRQLPGLAVQRLMQKGYGFGAEGDWKTAAMCHLLKRMSANCEASFMEDYTYHLRSGEEFILGAHMLEVCPSIADGKIRIDVQPLSIGNREAPARMLFEGKAGDAVAVSLIDLGNHFRLIAAKVNCIKLPHTMPKLPVAFAAWRPYPDFSTGIKAWLLAGGAHHTVLCYRLGIEHIRDLARMLDVECVVIDENTNIQAFERDLAMSDFLWSQKNTFNG